MARWREGFQLYQQDVFSWCIQMKLKLYDAVVLKSHNRCTNQLASSVVFVCLSLTCCAGSS